MKILRRYRMPVILFFYLFSAYVGATHIHHDVLVSHDDCKVCVVAKNLHGNDVTVAAPLLAAIDLSFEPASLPSAIITILTLKGFDAHAPPVFL